MGAHKKPLECFHRILWDCDHPGFVELFRELDPSRFMRQVKGAGFEGVGLFAKDSLGQSLYPTEIGRRHPGLSRDFLGEMTAAAKAEGLAVVAYYNCTQDPYHARTRPEWREYGPGDQGMMAAEATTSAAFVCLHGGFTETILIPQLLEIATRYPTNGFFLDIGSEPHTRRVCACATCRADYQRDLGRALPRPDSPCEEWLDYAHWRKARHRRVQQRILSAVRTAHPEVSLTVNYAYSARQPDPPEGVTYLSLDVEEHTNPLLGAPSYLRHANTQGLPVEVFVSHMQHWWWDWDLRPLPAMQLQAAEILANGGAVCVGSNLHPTGRLDDRIMAQLKRFNDFLREREPFCRDATPLANVAVLHSAATLTAQSAVGYSHGSLVKALTTFRGAARILLEGHVPFQFLNEADLRRTLAAYDMLVLPEQSALSDETICAVTEFVAKGGRLVAIGETASQDELGRARERPALDGLLGVQTRGAVPHACAYGRFREDSGFALRGPLLLEGTWMRVDSDGAKTLVDLIEPYHGVGPEQEYQALGVGLPPPAEKIIGAAATVRNYGNGVAAYIAGPVCTQHGLKTQLEWRDAVLWMVRRLLPDPLLDTDAPPTVEIALARQPNRILCHVINYANEKGYSLRQLPEFVAPIFDIGITLRAGNVIRVTCYPGGQPLEFTRSGHAVSFRLPRLDIHSIITLELKEPSHE